MSLTAERARELFHYDADTGVLLWKPRENVGGTDHLTKVWNMRFANKEAGAMTGNGYRAIIISPKRYLAHRIIWLMETGEWPTKYIDHKDGNKLNNRMSNLRQATHSQNMCNVGVKATNTTGIKGISFDKRQQSYCWEVCANGARKRGRCKSLEQAIAAHKNAAAELHGEFWRAA